MVLWCRRRWRAGSDVRGVMASGARKSRTGAEVRANALGERSLADMLSVAAVIWRRVGCRAKSGVRSK